MNLRSFNQKIYKYAWSWVIFSIVFTSCWWSSTKDSKKFLMTWDSSLVTWFNVGTVCFFFFDGKRSWTTKTLKILYLEILIIHMYLSKLKSLLYSLLFWSSTDHFAWLSSEPVLWLQLFLDQSNDFDQEDLATLYAGNFHLDCRMNENKPDHLWCINEILS